MGLFEGVVVFVNSKHALLPFLRSPTWFRGIGIALLGTFVLQGCGQTTGARHGSAYSTYKSALAAQKENNHDEAARLYTNVLNAGDRRLYASAHINRAQAFKEVGKFEKSLDDHNAYLRFKTASGEKPSSKQFYLSRADVLVNLNQLAEARADVERARGFVGMLDEKMAEVGKLGGGGNVFDDSTTIMFAILYEKIGDQTEGMKLVNEALEKLQRNPGPTNDFFIFMALLTRATFHMNATSYDASLEDLDKAEKQVGVSFAAKETGNLSTQIFRKMINVVISLHRAYVLDLSGHHQAAIVSLRDVRSGISELSVIAPDKQKVAEAKNLLDRAQSELETISADQNSKSLLELVTEHGDGLQLNISFTENINLES